VRKLHVKLCVVQAAELGFFAARPVRPARPDRRVPPVRRVLPARMARKVRSVWRVQQARLDRRARAICPRERSSSCSRALPRPPAGRWSGAVLKSWSRRMAVSPGLKRSASTSTGRT